jgi:multicomponent Na+:H+ antiporter subunit D
MRLVPALAVAVPLFVAGLLAAGTTWLPRWLIDGVAVSTAVATTGMCAWLVVHTHGGTLVYWFGGWTPRDGLAIGISFVFDPVGAGLATVTAALAAASLVFTWRYFEAVGSLYHALILVFMAAMVGFCLSGDLFNLFVFFELMGVAAYGLTGYKIEEVTPLQGALNFAVTNTVGASMILIGIALVYGRTGALNLAQAGRALSSAPIDGLVVAAFVLLLSGFLVKGAIVPFHFWLADAHAVAPSPVCALLSGVMVELGIYGVARVYWTLFSGAVAPTDAVRGLFVVMGLLTALVGAAMTVQQRHLKRLLAYSTIAHAGLVLSGFGLLSSTALAGVAILTVEHALAKASLFLCVGIVVHRLRDVDETSLYRRGRALPFTALVFFVGALILAGMPFTGASAGRGLIDAAASERGLHWLPVAFGALTAVSAGAVLRAGVRVFLGWGSLPLDAGLATQEPTLEREVLHSRRRTPLVLFVPALLLAVAALLVGHRTELVSPTTRAAAAFVDRVAYQAVVLVGRGGAIPAPPLPASAAVWPDVVTTLGAVAVAGLALFGGRVGGSVRTPLVRGFSGALSRLRALHSGHIGDYVAWLTLGVAVIGVWCSTMLH